MAELLFEWDEDKATFNAAKHGVSFETAMQAFYVDGVVAEDQRRDYREQRFNRFAVVAVFPICVSYTLRGDVVRLISARKQNRKER